MPNLITNIASCAIALTVYVPLALFPTVARADLLTAAFVTNAPTSEPIAAIVAPSATPGPTLVPLNADFVTTVYVERDIGAILLGNASIADATMTDGRMIILRGVAHGVTNIIVMDTEGRELAEFLVQVSDRNPGTVTVRRAMDVQFYSCLEGICESAGSSGVSPGPDAAPATGMN